MSGNARYIIAPMLDAVGRMKIVEPPEFRARLLEIAASIASANQTEDVAP